MITQQVKYYFYKKGKEMIMKRLFHVLTWMLAFTMLLSAAAFAAGSNSDTLVNWDIKITTPDDTVAVLKGNWYYIYTKQEGRIPYVMVTVFNLERDSDRAFFEELTESMKSDYADLRLTSDVEQKTIGGKNCSELDYSYQVSGYDVIDRRIITVHNGRTYMFASKEVPELKLYVDNLLEDTVRESVFLSDGEKDALPDDIGEPEAEDALMYLYCQDNGMPKYWLDLTGTMSHNPVLHCYFRSGEPTFYESWFILDSETAVYDGDSAAFSNVYDAYGFDLSNRFLSLVIREEGSSLVLSVVRDEKTLAGGSEDNILTGEYVMKPMGSRVVYEATEANRQLLYRLEPEEDRFLLHRITSGGEDRVYILDLESAEYEGEYSLTVSTVFDEDGKDVSDEFNSVSLSEVEGAVIMVVNSKAGAEGVFIPSNVYLFEPKTSFVPLKNGPYTAKELGSMAQQYYLKNNGFFPPEADVERKADGSFTVHLYEIVDLDGVSHTATSAWYTVDEYGVGQDDILGTPVILNK